jgi:catechol-2,3-dioxygenase
MNIFKLALLALSIAVGGSAYAATPSKSESSMSTKPPALQVSVIDHVGMNVPDIDEATRFFADLMGARVISDISPGAIPDQWKTQFRWHHERAP